MTEYRESYASGGRKDSFRGYVGMFCWIVEFKQGLFGQSKAFVIFMEEVNDYR
ncbi:MAG: hypothetical protein ACI9S8_000760 [Chlamydiales bacterium]|jgi:hypothetical protein